MSDPEPSDAEPQRRRRTFFGLGRRHDGETDAPENPTGGSEVSAPATPQAMRLRIQEFQELRVEDVMVARAEVKAVEVNIEFPDLLKVFAECTHSRLPVFRETLDDPIGFVHIKDVVSELAKDGDPVKRPLERLHREVLYVPPSMKLTDLLVKMQSTRIHLALVVDEYGGTDGLVSLEDLVEEIVGDIEDEHDDEEPMFVRRSARIWEVDARTEIQDFAEETGIDLELNQEDSEFDTLGGIAYALAGRVPVRGEVLRHPSGVEIEVLDADARRIRRLRVRTPEPVPAPKPQE
jgi:CBS domain containing-hemolysin-like protein